MWEPSVYRNAIYEQLEETTARIEDDIMRAVITVGHDSARLELKCVQFASERAEKMLNGEIQCKSAVLNTVFSWKEEAKNFN